MAQTRLIADTRTLVFLSFCKEQVRTRASVRTGGGSWLLDVEGMRRSAGGGGGVHRGTKGTWGQVMESVSQMWWGQLSPGHMVAAANIYLQGWLAGKTMNLEAALHKEPHLTRPRALSLACCPAGARGCWGACEQLYSHVTCKRVEAGETMARWRAGKPAEDTKWSFQVAEAQRWQSGATDPQA